MGAGADPGKGNAQSVSHVALKETGIPTIISYWEEICDTVFNAALGNKDNKLNKLLTEANKAPYLLRNQQYFALPKWKTDRFKNTFILSSCLIKVQLNCVTIVRMCELWQQLIVFEPIGSE